MVTIAMLALATAQAVEERHQDTLPSTEKAQQIQKPVEQETFPVHLAGNAIAPTEV